MGAAVSFADTQALLSKETRRRTNGFELMVSWRQICQLLELMGMFHARRM
jgi:hypothetical protein